MCPYKIKVIYKVGGVHFTAEADTLSEAYEYISAIIKANATAFPRQEEALSEMIKYLAQMDEAGIYSRDTHIFRIEKTTLREEK